MLFMARFLSSSHLWPRMISALALASSLIQYSKALPFFPPSDTGASNDTSDLFAPQQMEGQDLDLLNLLNGSTSIAGPMTQQAGPQDRQYLAAHYMPNGPTTFSAPPTPPNAAPNPGQPQGTSTEQFQSPSSTQVSNSLEPNVNWTDTLVDQGFFGAYYDNVAQYCNVEDFSRGFIQSLGPHASMQYIPRASPDKFLATYIFHPGQFFLFADETMRRIRRMDVWRADKFNDHMLSHWQDQLLAMMNPNQQNHTILLRRQFLSLIFNDPAENGIGARKWLIEDYMSQTFGDWGFRFDPNLSSAEKNYRDQALQAFMRFPQVKDKFFNRQKEVRAFIEQTMPVGIPVNMKDIVLSQFTLVSGKRYGWAAGFRNGSQPSQW